MWLLPLRFSAECQKSCVVGEADFQFLSGCDLLNRLWHLLRTGTCETLGVGVELSVLVFFYIEPVWPPKWFIFSWLETAGELRRLPLS